MTLKQCAAKFKKIVQCKENNINMFLEKIEVEKKSCFFKVDIQVNLTFYK